VLPHRSVAGLARYFHCSPDRVGPEQIRAYLLYLLQEHGVSQSYFNLTRCALRFFYERIEARGAEFTMAPTQVPGSTIARLNDRSGNLIQNNCNRNC
jgi:hypothetical protein